MSIISQNITQQWQLLPIEDVTVVKRQRDVDAKHVKAIEKSFNDLGGQMLIQPIVVDGDSVLIDGAHRLQAAKNSGWTHIAAIVCSGATIDDRAVLEFEANRIRKELSAQEVSEAWEKFYKPAAVKAATERMHTAGVNAMNNSNTATDNIGSSENEARTLAKAARETTGHSVEWLNRINAINRVAADPEMPETVRETARRAQQQLFDPKAKVDPLYKKVQAAKELAESQGLPVEARRAGEAEELVDKLVSDACFLAGRVMQDKTREAFTTAPKERCAAQFEALKLRLVECLAVVLVTVDDAGIEALDDVIDALHSKVAELS